MKKNKKVKSINEAVNLVGKKTENKIRSNIHSLLAEEKSIELLKKSIPLHLKTLKGVKENTEIFSQQLNLPTKTDIANIAKLVIQVEEKLDALEEKILHLSQQKPTKSNKKKKELEQGLPSLEKVDVEKFKKATQLRKSLKKDLLMSMIKIPDDEKTTKLLEKLDKRVERSD